MNKVGMRMFRTISVIGGDLRQLTLAKGLEQDGNRVSICGFDKNSDTGNPLELCELSEALKSDVVVLPLPVSHDQILLNAPFSSEKIRLCELIKGLTSKQLVLGGKFTPAILNLLSEQGVTVVDYFEREELNVANAIPTAEGAIEIALAELPITLHKSRCLVVGFGRIGKVLADRLKAFGAEVTVSARKCADFAWIEAYGYRSVHSTQLGEIKLDYDVIFNTVPYLLFDDMCLKKLSSDCLLIDLASKPGGIDFEAAQRAGVKAIWALSLPGKSAPITSGEIIKTTVTNIMREMEES